MHPDNIEAGGLFGALRGFKVGIGARYICVYIIYDESKHECLKYRMVKWERNIHAATKTAGKYLQKSYVAVVCAIQSEWIYILTRD